MKVRTLDTVVSGTATTARAEVVVPTKSGASSVQGSDVQVGAQAGRVQVAHSQLSALPDVDSARVAEIKAALARGEIAFDPQKIAGLVLRHHGGRG